MPDLRSELSKVINAWETPEVNTQPAPTSARKLFSETTGTTRATFDYVRDNPGCTRIQVTDVLDAKGHKRNSVASLLVQMVRQGMVRESNGLMYVTQPEYTPLKARLRKAAPAKPEPKEIPAAKRKYVRRNAAAKAAAYEAHENYNPTAFNHEPKVVAPPEFNAEDFVNGLTLKQAKAVYGELKKVFE